MKKVELLAPCGNYESFLAAVNAGADAVYLAGNKYGARAYADNFSEETLIQVIHLAHLWDVKVYMTVNTLVKEEEFGELYDYMNPYVSAGLDGAIIQDLGVFSFFQETFPSLELHASTQMTITGVYGADYLKKKGCKRIVPSRELSLHEICEIKKRTNLEIEAFIHGAMCYCYSGKCLMSSFIGGRSGNRGRCAQPCRLPYRIQGKEQYYLSLKDMNTLLDIPRLIDAGIDSFKIEGRMKKPEYVAGVVSLYRKYIDLYQKNPKGFHVDEKDMELLRQLYIRSETGNGYYDKPRGRDMITLSQPGYNGTDEKKLQFLREKYLRELPKIAVSLNICLQKDKPIYGKIQVCMPSFFHNEKRNVTSEQITCELEGAVVGLALNRAATAEDIKKQMSKLGNTSFVLDKCDVQMESDLFVPVKVLNEFRRALIQKVYEKINQFYGLDYPEVSVLEKEPEFHVGKSQEIIVSVMSRDQFHAALISESDTVLIDSDLIYDGIISSFELKALSEQKKWGIKLPEIIRLHDEKYLEKINEMIALKPDVISCNSLDALGYVKQSSFSGSVIGDAGLYAWNSRCVEYLCHDLDRVTLPLELNSGEIRTVCKALGDSVDHVDMVVYGKAPLMVTANCLKLTTGKCNHNRQELLFMKDRMGHDFSVYTNCNHCYNMIYNYLPTSLHDSIWMLLEDGIGHFRVDFSDESGKDAALVIQTFKDLISSNPSRKHCEKVALPFEVTNGHMRRGVQ